LATCSNSEGAFCWQRQQRKKKEDIGWSKRGGGGERKAYRAKSIHQYERKRNAGGYVTPARREGREKKGDPARRRRAFRGKGEKKRPSVGGDLLSV